jgi:uncharacterized membrane protein
MSIQQHAARRSFIAGLRRYFLAGLAVLVPVAATIIILAMAFERLDNILQPAAGAVIRWFEPGFQGRIPGLGIVLSLVLIFGAGITASNYTGRRAIKLFESLLVRIPVLRQIYLAAQRVMKTFAGTSGERIAFRRVVFVEFPFKGVISGALVTNELKDPRGNKLYALYIPTPPNPLSGYMIIADADMVMESDMSVDAAFKMAITAGLISPPALDVSIPG